MRPVICEICTFATTYQESCPGEALLMFGVREGIYAYGCSPASRAYCPLDEAPKDGRVISHGICRRDNWGTERIRQCLANYLHYTLLP